MAWSFGLVELAGKISPEVFVAYLEGTGWKLFPQKDPHIRVFQQEKDGRLFQATIPISHILGDYEEAMYRATESVAACEGKPVCRFVQHLASQPHRQGQ